MSIPLSTTFRAIAIVALALVSGRGAETKTLPTSAVTAIAMTSADASIAAGRNRRYTATASFQSGPSRELGSAPIAAGGSHTCVLLADGTVECWGSNAFGQLGDGTEVDSPAPRSVPGLANVIAIAAGENHTCAIVAGGTMACWGDNFRGQLGDGSFARSPTPVSVEGIATATAVAAGGEHTCALLADRSVRCWGRDFAGQLGNGTDPGSNVPVAVLGIADAVAVSAGSEHTCALLANGTPRCWGRNFFGQLGDGTNDDSDTPVGVHSLTNVVAVSAGDEHTCAILADGAARCWGRNAFGRLGNGTPGDSNVPVAVSGITTARAIDAGERHTCATLADGTVRCWGSSASGQIGDGSAAGGSFDTPVAVVEVVNTAAIAVGGEHACALSSAGALRCWGANGEGQLGIGRSTGPEVCGVAAACSSRPVVAGGLGVAAVATGLDHSCALFTDGTMSCWGENGSGQLGNGSTEDAREPVMVSGITNAIAISAGLSHTCALLADGSVRCWGWNQYGQLGIGSRANSSLPVTVHGIATATAVEAGHYHTCAVLSIGTVECWGYNRFGSLGTGSASGPQACGSDFFGDIACATEPVAAAGIDTAESVSAGYLHSCALLAGGALRCWGGNTAFELGNANQDGCAIVPDSKCSATPISVTAITTATMVSAGYEFTCATLEDGTARCWGSNFVGKLGTSNASYDATPTPQVVTGIADAVEISAGSNHACARLASGALRCWGYRDALGSGNTTSHSSTPVAVIDISPAVAVSAGSNASNCAIPAEGAVRCWGLNAYGEVGIGTVGLVPTPVAVSRIFDAMAAVVWSSLDPGVASIGPDGVATGIAEGTTTIAAAATNFDVSGGTTLTVPEPGPLLATAVALLSLARLATRRRAGPRRAHSSSGPSRKNITCVA